MLTLRCGVTVLCTPRGTCILCPVVLATTNPATACFDGTRKKSVFLFFSFFIHEKGREGDKREGWNELAYSSFLCTI